MTGCFSIISLVNKFIRRTLTGAGLSSQSIAIDDQTTIHFWGPKTSSNRKPALVLIHGFGPDATWHWSQQAVFFAPNFDIYIPYLVLFGDSTTKSPERSVNFQAVSVGKMLEKVGVERYSVVGTSYGGFVAYQMAALWPERVEKIVIASSAINKRDADDEELKKKAKVDKIEELMVPATAKQMRTLLPLVVHRQPPYMPNFILNDLMANGNSNRKQKMELIQETRTLEKDLAIGASFLQQEVLIVWGENDQIFLLEKAIELKELLGAKARLEVINKAGHTPQTEQPRIFNNIVNTFLTAFL